MVEACSKVKYCCIPTSYCYFDSTRNRGGHNKGSSSSNVKMNVDEDNNEDRYVYDYC